jgi:hypothetical protein
MVFLSMAFTCVSHLAAFEGCARVVIERIRGEFQHQCFAKGKTKTMAFGTIANSIFRKYCSVSRSQLCIHLMLAIHDKPVGGK